MKTKKLMIVDGNSLIHRGFHALPHLSTSKGFPTNGIYGFITIFLNAVKKIQPDYVAVAFDLEGPTFRDKLFKEYKAGRAKAPQELYDQIPKVKDFVRSLSLPIFEKQGFEADDVIGTIARHPRLTSPLEGEEKEQKIKTTIVTGDLDSLQLVDADTTVFATIKGLSEVTEYNADAVRARYGFGPEHVVDYKALRGDPSDNIPGVSGIGEKGAADLIKKFGSVEEIYKELEAESAKAKKLPEKTREKLLAQKEQCLLSKKLATVDTRVPVNFELEKTRLGGYKVEDAHKFLMEFELKSLLDKLPRPAAEDGEVRDLNLQQKVKVISKKYHLIKNQDELDSLVKKLKNQKGFVIDTETTSQKEMEAELLGVSVCYKAGEAYYVSMHRQPVLGQPHLDTKEFAEVLENKKTEKWGHNIKYDFLVLNLAGIDLQPLSFDTMIAAYVLNPGSRGYGLDDLAFSRLGYQMMPIEALIGKGRQQITLDKVPIEQVAQYSCEDADYTLRLKEELEPALKKEGVDKIFYEIDQPLVAVLGLMEKNGIALDPQIFSALSKKLVRKIGELENKIHKSAGSKFNINSPKQLKEILFTKLRISTADIKKTKTGLSTAASELEKMKDAHPIVPQILEYRELSKLQNTYVDALPDLVNKATGRLHTSFNQTIAATGRLSSTDPNLQNIPIRTDLGNEIRKGFVAGKGKVLLSCDYSQIELRVVAHLSGDRVMQKVFRQGKDIHTATAAEVFGIKESEVGKEERRYAKVINFGVLYGLSAYGFTQQIPGVTREKAQAFIDKYFLTYQGVKKYTEEIVEQTRKLTWVCNPLGRKRFLPEINSSQFPVRSAAERAAINTPIQSLAADIIKVAMIDVAKKIGVENPECRMLLQVHDELLFEVDKDKLESYARQIKKYMEGAIELSVPVEVEAKAGKNWGEMEKLKI